MPASYRIDKSLGMVFTKGEGVLTGQDILTHELRLREDPDFDPSYNQLIDLRGVIEFAASAAEMRAISAYHRSTEKSRRAMVAEKRSSFGMMRMYEMLREAEPDQIKVFRDMAEARRWLGLD